MPSSAARRSPRAAPVPRAAPAAAERPFLVPYAVVFGLLTAGVVPHLGRLLWSGDPELDRFLVVPMLLAATAVTGAGLVWRGVRGGWVLLAVAALVPLLGVFVVAFVFGALGAVADMWLALLPAVAPITCLVLALRAPVRGWCAPRRATRPAGGTRTARRAR